MKFVEELLENETNLHDKARGARARRRHASAPEEAYSLTDDQLAFVEPALEGFYSYLDELCEVLTKKCPKVWTSYDIMGMTTLKNLLQGDYRLDVDSVLIPRFRLSFLCKSEAGTSISVGTEYEFAEAREYLYTHGVRHRVESQSEAWSVIRVEGFVPVSLAFGPHPTEPCLRIRATNLDRLGISSYHIDPNRVDRALMDEFGKRILRMDNQFDHMAGFRVSDEVRAELRKRVAARQAVRESLFNGKAKKKDIEADSKIRIEPPTAKLGSSLRRKVEEAAAAAKKSQAAREGNGAAAAASSVPAHPVPQVRQVSGPVPGVPAYAWVVTRHGVVSDTDVSVGKLGPDGASKRFRVNEVLLEGRAFQMRGKGGEVLYKGFLKGRATGMEPLNDYGVMRGCTSIQYQQNGAWVTLAG